MIALRIEHRLHVLLHRRPKILARRIAIHVRLNVVLHHFEKILIAGLVLMHQRPDHLQNVGALRVHQAIIRASAFERVEAYPHPDGTRVIRRHAVLILIRDFVQRAIPELVHLIRLLGLFQK